HRAIFADRSMEDCAELDRVCRDESRYTPGATAVGAVCPETTEEVTAAPKRANHTNVTASVRGTGTGMNGGALAYPGGLVISLKRLNRINWIDPVNRLAEVQAGVINAHLNRAAAEHGMFFAPDPASAEISTIGGNIATNAGGLRCVSHG